MWETVLLGAVLLFGYALFRRSLRHLLVADKMFPGPPTLPIIGNAHQVFSNRKDIYGYAMDNWLLFKRSTRLWVGPSLFIFITDPKEVEKVFGTSNVNEKAELYEFTLDWIGRGLLTSSGPKWRKSRKILTPAFHFNTLKNFLEIFQRNGDILMEKLAENIGTNFNVYNIIKLYALDNICETSMGTKVNAQLDSNSVYAKAVEEMCEIVMSRLISPMLWPKFLFNLSNLKSRQTKMLSVIHGITNEVIVRRTEMFKNMDQKVIEDEGSERKERQVFLDILLQASEDGGLTLEEIRDEVNTFMFVGHDTVTSAISFALYCLATNSVCQQKAYEEMAEIFGIDNRPATYKDLQNMIYLEKIIKETLRLYPSAPIMARHISQDIHLDERTMIPKGCQVALLIPFLHRDPTKWEKSEEFYPEHFELDAIAKRHPYQYIPFSAGPRNCIGMKFAMLEIKSSLSRILRNFRLLPADPPVPIQLAIDIMLVSRSGINIRLVKRDQV